MEDKAGIVRIGIPTGLGRNGVRKEALEIARRMLQEMSSKPVTHKWCKYYIPDPEDYKTFFGNCRWGMVISAHVENVEYAKAIMLSFEYDDVIELYDKKKDMITKTDFKTYLFNMYGNKKDL